MSWAIIAAMGIGSWLAGGVLAWVLARIVPLSRGPGRWSELAVALAFALILGTLATALDFGGWAEPDWRAAAFVFAGAFAALGLFRLTIARSPGGPP